MPQFYTKLRNVFNIISDIETMLPNISTMLNTILNFIRI